MQSSFKKKCVSQAASTLILKTHLFFFFSCFGLLATLRQHICPVKMELFENAPQVNKFEDTVFPEKMEIFKNKDVFQSCDLFNSKQTRWWTEAVVPAVRFMPICTVQPSELRLNKHLSEMTQTKAPSVFTHVQYRDVSVFARFSVDERFLENV